MPLPFRCLQGNFIRMNPFDLRRLGRWLVCAALVFPVAAGSTEVTYQNPVIPGDHPDPSIIRVGKDYWATCTSSAWGPLFPLLHSRDLVNWEQTGAVLNQRPDWAVGDFWAPEISEYHGNYFVYFVGRQHDGRLAVAVATAKKPGGPYTDHGPLVAQADGSIDPMPVTDVDGARYLIWKEDGNSRGQPTPIWAQRLDDVGTKLVGQPREMIRNDVAWEGPLVEGPYILRRSGWFYLFYSGNGCCGRGCSYALGVARSRSLFGPWQKNPANPILAGNAVWKCPGHGSVVQDKQGRCWFLYHAYSAKGTIFTGRVAHGYFVLSKAAGLFVDAKKGPVLLNYGIDEARFTKPVYPGMTIGVRLTVKEKTAQEKRTPEDIAKGIVRWLVDVYDETGETVAIATILTMVRMKNQEGV